jgi:hypothetical protein
MAFWITCHTRAKKGHEIDGMMTIKLFRGNYAREIYRTEYPDFPTHKSNPAEHTKITTISKKNGPKPAHIKPRRLLCQNQINQLGIITKSHCIG